MMRLHSLGASRASLNGFADAFVINIAADANDHANDLQHVRMIVKNDSQLQENITAQETGGVWSGRLAL